MILIVCVDDNLGMLFNHRRQSQDRVLRARVLELTSGARLWMNAYSHKQFEAEGAPHIIVDDAFLNKAGRGDYCFAEDIDILPYEDSIERIIIYKWNRRYPADLHFTIPLQEHGWKLVQTTDFAGSSHEKITEEVYEK